MSNNFLGVGMQNKTRWFVAAALSLFFVAALRDLQGDIWYQMLAGRYAIAHGAPPFSDFFNYAGAGSPQLFGGWGYGALFELSIRTFGLQSASWLNSAIWAGAMGLAFWSARLRDIRLRGFQSSWNAFQASAAWALIGFGLFNRMSMRAESVLALVWFASFVVFELSMAKKKLHWSWVALPLLCLLESLAHTAAFLLVFPWAIGCALGLWNVKSARSWTWAGASLVAMAALSVATPNGFQQATSQIQSVLALLAEAKPAEAASAVNIEYLPIWAPQMSGMALPFFAVFALFLTVALRLREFKGAWVEALACVVFLAMAALHIRAIGLAAVALAIPALQAAMAGKLLPLAQIAEARARWGGVFPLWLAKVGWGVRTISVLLLLSAPWAISWSTSQWDIQPAKARAQDIVDVIKKDSPAGAKIYAAEAGYQLAYLLGDGYLISTASHQLVENKPAMDHQMALLSMAPGWESELDKADFVCLPLYAPMPKAGYAYALPKKLSESGRWKYFPQGGFPCELFERLPAGSPDLSIDQRMLQTLQYMEATAYIANMSARVYDDVAGQDLVEKMIPQILALRKARESFQKASEKQPSR